MWNQLLSRPPNFAPGVTADNWFASIAQALLNRAVLVVAGQPHRLLEVEFYYNIAGHADDFTHSHPIQAFTGRWYFHATGSSYRGGSFKGFDMTLGDGVGLGGILFRGLETPDGNVIDGPSLLVDHLLKLTQQNSVAELDAQFAQRLAWDTSLTVWLREAELPQRPLLRTARVGLSWKRRTEAKDRANQQFLTARYRYLSEPLHTRKGKPQIIVALHQDGIPSAEIRTRTGSPLKTIQRYITAYESGRQETKLAKYYGHAWSAEEYCRLAGAISGNEESR